MDSWAVLGQWADKNITPLIITLLEAPLEFAALIGRVAVAEGPGRKAQGELAQAPFWTTDLVAVLGDALADLPPETGRIVENAGRRYLVSRLVRNRSALVLGGGHVGSALCRLLRFLDFEVTLMDDRPEFLKTRDDGVATIEAPFDQMGALFADSLFDAVIIVTRGHAQDSTCLRQALAWPSRPGYLGMIGSRSRTRETLGMLAMEGFSPERLRLVHTPVGLKINAQTPEEIAVSIAAELILTLNKLPLDQV